MAPMATKKQRVTIILDDSDEDMKVFAPKSKTISAFREKMLVTPPKDVNRAVRAMSVLSIATSCTLGVESDGEIKSEPLPRFQSHPAPNSRKRPREHKNDNVERRHQDHSRTHNRMSKPPALESHVEVDSDEEEDDMPIKVQLDENRVLIDLDNWNKEDENGLELEVFGKKDPFEHCPLRERNQPYKFKRNIPISESLVQIDEYECKGMTLRPNMAIELKNGKFLDIKVIVKNWESGQVTLRGWELRRCSTAMDGMLLKQINEMCYIFEVDLEDPRDFKVQGMIEVAPSFATALRELIRTNKPRKPTPYAGEQKIGESKTSAMQRIREQKSLYVRHKFTRVWPTALLRENSRARRNHFKTTRIESLTEEECDFGQYMSATLLRKKWRKIETTLGGSGVGPVAGRKGHAPLPMSEKARKEMEEITHKLAKMDDGVDVDPALWDRFKQIEDQSLRKEAKIALKNRKSVFPGKRYTYGDTFSGGGGSTRGAKMAGLGVKYMMDCGDFCIQTLKANFPEANVYHEMSNDFVTRNGDLEVDVLHLSPPCQVWSPAHTREGQNDEQNFASLFAVIEILRKTRPRMVTLEQTFGILMERFEIAFNSLIHAFTCKGYSVSWQSVKLQELGLPQNRMRLIMFAAGPGETLPEFPAMTHSNIHHTEFKPFTTPRSVLRIPEGALNHNIERARGRGNYMSWDDLQITRCITTSGGSHSSFPDGSRSLTHREFAALQLFPHDHAFLGTHIRKQIGNAVPPGVAMAWFTHIRKHLEQQDRLELANTEKNRIDLTKNDADRVSS